MVFLLCFPSTYLGKTETFNFITKVETNGFLQTRWSSNFCKRTALACPKNDGRRNIVFRDQYFKADIVPHYPNDSHSLNTFLLNKPHLKIILHSQWLGMQNDFCIFVLKLNGLIEVL
jgi:hypothetical protein